MASPLANAVAFISHNLNKQILCCCGSYSNTPQKKIKNYFSANSILKNRIVSLFDYQSAVSYTSRANFERVLSVCFGSERVCLNHVKIIYYETQFDSVHISSSTTTEQKIISAHFLNNDSFHCVKILIKMFSFVFFIISCSVNRKHNFR